MLDGGEIPVFAASLTVVAAILFLRRFKQIGAKDDGKRYPPSLPVLPLVGTVFRGGMSVIPEHFMKSADKIGPVFSFAVGKRLVVILNSHEAIFDALVRHSEAFADRPPGWTEKELINKEMRGLINSPFDHAYKKYNKLTLSILREFGFGVQSVSETRILQEIETMNEEILRQNGRPFNPAQLLTFATSNFVLSILFGTNFLLTFPKEHSTIVESSHECIANTDFTVNMAPFVRFLPIFGGKMETLRAASERLLKAIEVGIEFSKVNNTEPTFVRRFMEIEGSNYDHQDLVYILRDLCFASTDTVSSTMQWAVVEMANHPEVQSRCRREIDEMIPGERLPSLDDKPRLPYTEAVILEIMRLRSVAPFLVPRATLRDTKVLEYDIPKESMIISNAYSAHRNTAFWGDPENFRPERFLDADNKIINSNRMIGFGLGKRSCLGEVLGRQKVFLFLTSLVQRFNILPPDGQKSVAVKEIIVAAMIPSPYEVRMIHRVKPTQH